MYLPSNDLVFDLGRSSTVCVLLPRSTLGTMLIFLEKRNISDKASSNKFTQLDYERASSPFFLQLLAACILASYVSSTAITLARQ